MSLVFLMQHAYNYRRISITSIIDESEKDRSLSQGKKSIFATVSYY